MSQRKIKFEVNIVPNISEMIAWILLYMELFRKSKRIA